MRYVNGTRYHFDNTQPMGVKWRLKTQSLFHIDFLYRFFLASILRFWITEYEKIYFFQLTWSWMKNTEAHKVSCCLLLRKYFFWHEIENEQMMWKKVKKSITSLDVVVVVFVESWSKRLVDDWFQSNKIVTFN